MGAGRERSLSQPGQPPEKRQPSQTPRPNQAFCFYAARRKEKEQLQVQSPPSHPLGRTSGRGSQDPGCGLGSGFRRPLGAYLRAQPGGHPGAGRSASGNAAGSAFLPRTPPSPGGPRRRFPPPASAPSPFARNCRCRGAAPKQRNPSTLLVLKESLISITFPYVFRWFTLNV